MPKFLSGFERKVTEIKYATIEIDHMITETKYVVIEMKRTTIRSLEWNM